MKSRQSNGEYDGKCETLWFSLIKEAKLLWTEDAFDIHLFCQIKYIYHTLHSGETSHFTVGEKKFFMGCDSVSTTGNFNVKVSKNRPTSSSTRFIL